MLNNETTITRQSSTLVQSACLVALGFFGLMAGFFFAYSVDVMPALDLLQSEEAVSAMQAINIAVRNPVFFTCFFGTPILGAFAALLLFSNNHKRSAGLMLLASAVYFIGAFIPTAMINVPMNDALEAIALQNPTQDYSEIWNAFSPKWTFWNTARTIASLTALLIAGLALLQVKK